MAQIYRFDQSGMHLTDTEHDLMFRWKGRSIIEIGRLEEGADGMVWDQCINVYDHATGTVTIPFTEDAFKSAINEWLKDLDEINNPKEEEMDNPTLEERMERDGIRIVPELTETLYQNDNSSWVWKVTLGVYDGYTYGKTYEITIGQSINAGDSTPGEVESLAHVISNATMIEGDTSDVEFIEWAREFQEFHDGALRDSASAWDHVERAWETYQHILRETRGLREFLGDKYTAYLYETENDS